MKKIFAKTAIALLFLASWLITQPLIAQAQKAHSATTESIDWQADKTDIWLGYTRHHFKVDGCSCWVTVPENPLLGNQWVWGTEWPEAFTRRTGTEMLLKAGFYYVHAKVGTLSIGGPPALADMDAFYKYFVAKGLASKGTLSGVSRGGLYAYRFAAQHPERVVCIYGDAPVADLKSWPLGILPGCKRKEAGIKPMMEFYGFKDEAEAAAYKGNPVDVLEPIFKAGIPLIHVIGEVDENVPPGPNTNEIEKRYKALGGTITVFRKPKCGHHPHGLEDPTPVVELIKKYTKVANQ
ncbi:MAG: alpha/beta hydrolase [Kiritimatiellae bacterium]|jgi:hypothetical protein|nr:alpha/beta hydrolase [Kiritimatiellia bacterium]